MTPAGILPRLLFVTPAPAGVKPRQKLFTPTLGRGLIPASSFDTDPRPWLTGRGQRRRGQGFPGLNPGPPKTLLNTYKL